MRKYYILSISCSTKENKNMTNMKTWTQGNGIEIEEVEYDGDAHGFKIYVNDRYALMIYAGTAEVTEEVIARLNAGEDVRDFVDDDGNCVGTYIDEEEEWDEWKFTRKIKTIRKECSVCPMREECIISHAVNTIMNRSEKEWDEDTNRNCELMRPVISFCAEWCPHVDKEKLKGDVSFFDKY